MKINSLNKTIELLKKENEMLRQNNPLSFGELTKLATEHNDKAILNDISLIIHEFYKENMGGDSNMDPENYKSAKKCLVNIFKSI